MSKRWDLKFHRSIPNPTAPGGAVDMYEIMHHEGEETVMSLAVPTGNIKTPELVLSAVNAALEEDERRALEMFMALRRSMR